MGGVRAANRRVVPGRGGGTVTTLRRSYHHGDLRGALIDTAVELVAEHGARSFSLAEASRRLGVAVSAPYAHFADRDELLAAVAVRAYADFYAELEQELGRFRAPARRPATNVSRRR